jgi:phage N-6-adenine-methyltransferase
MNAPVAHHKRGDVAAFKPEDAKHRVADAEMLAERAARLKDWTGLDQAVEFIVDEQEEFVRWWRDAVPGPGKSNSARPGRISMADAEAATGIRHEQVSKWAKRLKDKPAYRATLTDTIRRKAMAEKGQTDQRGASGTGENEWYTPDEYLDAARDVLGAIDLDPASSDAAQAMVKAARHFTKADDGLAQEWEGRVWLNPPYAQPDIANFVSKMVGECTHGGVTAAIMLTHNYTDTSWFHEAAGIADAICFTRGRVKFYDAAGTIAAPTQGQAFFYFGPDVDRFASRFARVGFVVRPVTGEAADE